MDIKAEVKEEVLGEGEVSSGEGSTTVHGRVLLSTKERADLFRLDLEEVLESITCLSCTSLPPLPTFLTWRNHCQQHHSKDPLFQASLLPQTSPSSSGPHPCHCCGLAFPSRQVLEEHRESVVRTVRLVCPQCRGQYGDLEAHMQVQILLVNHLLLIFLRRITVQTPPALYVERGS